MMPPYGDGLADLLANVRACRSCESFLPLGAKPILVADPKARILIAGQAPGIKAHLSGRAWNDASGVRLRSWLGLSDQEFYDPELVALVPMGFCYPGKGPSGDNPPRPECRALWHARILPSLPHLRLRIVIGAHSQAYHLAGRQKQSLTETVAAWRDYGPGLFPLPHPSPRNQLWLRRNDWFERDLLPELRHAVSACGSPPL
jgi:uracil-DNA glycosylase